MSKVAVLGAPSLAAEVVGVQPFLLLCFASGSASKPEGGGLRNDSQTSSKTAGLFLGMASSVALKIMALFVFSFDSVVLERSAFRVTYEVNRWRESVRRHRIFSIAALCCSVSRSPFHFFPSTSFSSSNEYLARVETNLQSPESSSSSAQPSSNGLLMVQQLFKLGDF
jgi:hypothetical protein